MTFPTVQSVTLTTSFGSVTSHPVSMPATVNAGDLLLVLFSNFEASNGAATVTTPGGWSQLFSTERTAAGQGVRFGAYSISAAGTEGGTTVDFVTSANARAVAYCWHITGWFGTVATGVEAGVANTATTGATPDPPNLAPAWGSADNLWIACYGAAGVQSLVSYPTNYADNNNFDVSGGITGTCSLACASRNLTAASEDPGVFTRSAASLDWVANTIAVRPSSLTDPMNYVAAGF